MKKLNQLINKIEVLLSEILLAFIIIFVFAAALLRWIGVPLVWSVDLAQLLFVWICFIGADIALQKDRHIGVDFLTRAFPIRLQKTVLLLSYALIGAFLSLIAVFGTYLAIINYHRQFSGMEFSYSWATSSAPIGCLLIDSDLNRENPPPPGWRDPGKGRRNRDNLLKRRIFYRAEKRLEKEQPWFWLVSYFVYYLC